jgi:hypothetical protein
VILSFVVTHEEILAGRSRPRPTGIYWDLLDPEKLEQIPVLAALSGERRSSA